VGYWKLAAWRVGLEFPACPFLRRLGSDGVRGVTAIEWGQGHAVGLISG